MKLLLNPKTNLFQTVLRILLGAILLYSGISHLTWNKTAFLAQVPNILPFAPSVTVLLSGIAEIVLGAALIVLPKFKAAAGMLTAIYFVAIFPGNVAQYMNGIDSFGLNSDQSRLIRLFFQPVLILWALWSAGAFRSLKELIADRKKN